MAGHGMQVVADSDTLDRLAQQSMTEGKKGGKHGKDKCSLQVRFNIQHACVGNAMLLTEILFEESHPVPIHPIGIRVVGILTYPFNSKA
jgi:hypothetical protein